MKNREDLKKWLLATSDYGNEIQQDLNAIVGFDEKFNNAIVRHSLDPKDEAIFRNPNPINVTFHDMKKVDLVNPVTGKLAAQVRASKLTDYELTKNILEQGEIDKLQLRLDALKDGTNEDDDDEGKGSKVVGEVGGVTMMTKRQVQIFGKKTPEQEIEEVTRRLNFLRGDTAEFSPNNTPELNLSIIAQQNAEKIQNRQIREREKEIKNIPKGIIKKRKTSLNFNFPGMPPYTPPREDDFSRYLCPSFASTPIQNQDDNDFLSYLKPSQHILEPQEPRETSFLFSDGTKPESLFPLRNKLTNMAPLPSKPTIDNFARPITQMIHEKNNTIAITPKRPAPKIKATNLSEGLQSVFSDVDQTIKKESETFKERIEDLDGIIEKVSKISDDEDERKISEFQFFTGGFNQKFDSFAHSNKLLTENQEFIDFL